MSIAAQSDRPVVIAEVQDNPGGGGSADTTGIIKALLAAGATGAVAGIPCDPGAAAAAHRAGANAESSVSLGGHSGPAGVTPVEGVFRVVALGSGRFRATGEVARDAEVHLGPMAPLRLAGVDIVVASKRMQACNRAPFGHPGVDLPGMKIFVVRSSDQFGAEFEPLAEEVLIGAARGLVEDGIGTLPYRRLGPGVRLKPLGRPFQGAAPQGAPAGGGRPWHDAVREG